MRSLTALGFAHSRFFVVMGLCALTAIPVPAPSASSAVLAAAVFELLLDTTTVNFGTLIQTDYDSGFKEVSPAQQLTITSSANWALTVNSVTATWTAPWAKPAGHLQWKASIVTQQVRFTFISTSYQGMSTTPQSVATGRNGNNIKLNTHFKMLISYENDAPGNYSLGFTYTLAAQ